MSRVRLALAAALCALALPATATADPVPTPVTSSDLTPNATAKIAEPSDDVAHPGSWTEWWYAHVINPATKEQFVAFVFGHPFKAVGAFYQYGPGGQPLAKTPDVPHSFSFVGTQPVDDGLPGVRSSNADITYDPTRKAYHLVLRKGFQADIWFDGKPLPGPTGIIDLKKAGEWMGWTNPVATSTAHGWIQGKGGKKLSVDGWRGYHDHNWGKFTMVDQVADGWEWGVSHEPDGGATVLGGLVRRGGEWTGALADVRPDGTKVCSSTSLDEADWFVGKAWMTGSTFAIPGQVTVTCGPQEPYHFARTFSLVTPGVVDGGILAMTFEAQYRTSEGSLGMYEHVRSLLARFDARKAAGQ